MKTETKDVSGLPNCYHRGQKMFFRLDGNWNGEGILEDGCWEGNKYILTIRLTIPCKEHVAGTVIRVDNDEII